MSLLETPEFYLLERYLNLAAFRQQLIASNLANVDTPGYRTMDIDFRSEMERALTDPAAAKSGPEVIQVNGLPQRPDGNNVSVDRESMLLGRTQLQFQVGVELWRAEMQSVTDAIDQKG